MTESTPSDLTIKKLIQMVETLREDNGKLKELIRQKDEALDRSLYYLMSDAPAFQDAVIVQVRTARDLSPSDIKDPTPVIEAARHQPCFNCAYMPCDEPDDDEAECETCLPLRTALKDFDDA